MGALSNSFIKSFNSINMSNILKVFDYSRPYKSRVLSGGGSIDSDRLLKSLLLFFVQNNLDSNVLFAWNEFAGAKDGKCYNPFGSNDLTGTQEYDRGMVLFNGTDQNATLDVSGYSTIAIAYRTGDEVIITNSLTGLGEISGNTLYLGSNAAETEFYGFDLLALVVLNTSAYQLVESYLEMVPIGSKLNSLRWFSDYLARVVAGGDTVQDESVTKQIFKLLEQNSLMDGTRLLIAAEGGVDTRTSGVNVYCPKAYDFSPVNLEEVVANGVEKITTEDDRTFASDTGFWRRSAQVTISGGICSIISNDGSIQSIETPGIFLKSGKWYKIKFDIVAENVVGNGLKLSTDSIATFFEQNITGVGTKEFYVQSTGSQLVIARQSGVTDIDIDNISVLELTDYYDDAVQTTEANQPAIGGNIAPNELQSFKNVTGDSRTFTHPDIVVSGTYTIIKVLNAEDSGKVEISFTDVTSGTYNSISWTGQNYLYAIYAGSISASKQSALTTSLRALYPIIPSVQIGTQTWATSNYEAVASSNGTVITQATDNADWATGAARWRYHNADSQRGAIYGKLFNKAARDVIVANPPSGWHVATEAELTDLAALGGNALKYGGIDYWNTTGGTNSSGFTALGGSYINADGTFNTLKDSAAFWCADSDKVLKVYHNNNTAEVVAVGSVNEGYSIRLVKD